MTENDPDKLKLVIRLGIEMRDAQKQYFKTRDKGALLKSKDLERRFDAAAKEAVRI